MTQKKLILVDGSYYMFRAYHVRQLQQLNNAKGEPTGAIFGVINMLKKLIEEYQPDYFAIMFDARGKNFRHQLYPEYKANRPPMPEDLACQIQPIHNIIDASGIPKLIIDGVEADDVIATLAKQAEAADIKTLISTGDKDLAQLVNDHITILNTMQNVTLDRQGVIDKFGIGPELILDYLTLIGDTADNVPGIPKVGPKTAVKWLTEYGDLDNIVENADSIKGKVGESLRQHIPNLALSKELITLKYDVELEFKPDELLIGEADQKALKEQYQQWEFRSWLDALTGTEADEKKPEITHDYQIVRDEKSFLTWVSRLKACKLFAFDTETTSLDYISAEIVGLSFAIQSDEAAYVPLAHDYPGAPTQLDRGFVLQTLKPLLEDPALKKVGQNLKYDMNVLANYNIALNGIAHDSMLQSYVLNSTATRHNMDALASKYLQTETIHFEDIAGKGAKQLSFNQVSIEDAGSYAAEDADITLRLHETLWKELAADQALKSLYETIEIPLITVLSNMECNGVNIDSQMLLEQSHELNEKMQAIEQDAHKLAGEVFNISSPKQIQTILYEKMKLPVLSKTPKGQASTAESVLQELADDYELPGLILNFRSLSKLKSTYTDKLPQEVNPGTGRVHTSYHQAVAATGRLSSSDPNLQNIPVRTEEGRRIRQAFIAEKGYCLLAADYSQIELRIMAHLSADERLLEAFTNQEDVHKTTAAEVFAVNVDKVNSDQRRAAKAINFGLIYGMSAFGLAKQLGIQRSEAKTYSDRYFERYPGVKNYMDTIREQAHEQGYVETLFHRRLYLPEINAKNAMRRQYAERTAINAPMQGTAADIIKRAMIDVHDWLIKRNFKTRMIMQVHDELVLEVADDELDTVKTVINELMVNAAELSVPLEVDIGVGSNWNDAH